MNNVGILPSTSTTKANTTTGTSNMVYLHYNGTGAYNSDHGINIILLSKTSTSSWSDTGSATILSTFGDQSNITRAMWPTITTFNWFNSYNPVIKCRTGSCKLIYSLTTVT